MLDSFTISVKEIKKLPDLVVNNYPEVYGENANIITLVTYEFTGTKGGFTNSTIKELHPQYTGESFKAFNDLTETDIIGWIAESIVDEIKSEIEQQLDNTIINNSITMQLPWKQV